jgi:hypothetical protein
MWSLTPFEQYMVDDDCVDSPMNFTFVWSCEGRVDRQRLQKALDTMLAQHPLLTCQLKGKKWVSGDRRVVVQQADQFDQYGREVETIETSVVPLVVQLVDKRAGCTEIHMTFHHAACDGIGATEFCGDVFMAYANDFFGDIGKKKIAKRKQLGAVELLDSRNQLARPVVEGVSWFDAIRFLVDEAKWFFLDRATAIPCDGIDDHVVRSSQLLSIQLTPEETVALRRNADMRGASLNEFLMSLLTGVIGTFCQAPGQSAKSWVGVVQPVSMRPRLDRRMPACNGIGYAFYRRRIVECKCWEDLLPKMIRDSRAVGKYGLAGCFHDAIAVLQKVPNPFRKWFVRSMRPGTFVFSYLGDPRRRFAQPLGMSQDTLDLGDCKVVGFSAAPPPRKGTELGILASLFGQRLTVWVRPSQRLAGTSSMKDLFALIETAIREQVTASEMPTANSFGIGHVESEELARSR